MAVEQQPARILIVEDEEMVGEVVRRYLERDGHEVAVVADGAGALRRFDELRPGLVVLDLMLPGVDGLTICEGIRERGDTPIIMLTSRSEEADKLHGLRLGADDYITKPFSPRELAARVAAVLRRTRAAPTDAGAGAGCLQFGDLTVSAAERSVTRGGTVLELTAREFDLLLFLVQHAGVSFTRDELLDAVWGQEFAGDAATVTVHMRRLRTRIEVDPSRPRYLKTVWGVGYRFDG